MDEPQGYYAKQKEARHQSTHIIWFHLNEMFRIGQSIENESSLGLPRAGRGWDEELP